MNLAVNPPILPMLAKRVGELPPGEGWIFETKWDGFRTLIFRDGDEIFIQSRDEKPLNRYFPELIDPLKAQLPKRCVLDGESVIARQQIGRRNAGVRRLLRFALRGRHKPLRHAVREAARATGEDSK